MTATRVSINQGDIEPAEAPVLYGFELKRQGGMVRFETHLVYDHSGVGVQLTVADVNGDGANDMLCVSNLGRFVFLNGGK